MTERSVERNPKNIAFRQGASIARLDVYYTPAMTPEQVKNLTKHYRSKNPELAKGYAAGHFATTRQLRYEENKRLAVDPQLTQEN